MSQNKAIGASKQWFMTEQNRSLSFDVEIDYNLTPALNPAWKPLPDELQIFKKK